MEENLTDIELYFVRLEAEKVAKLAAEREAEIRKYSDVIPYDLGHMELSVYTNYLTGLKVAQEARMKAEKEAELARIESERIDKLGRERISEIYKYAQFQDALVSVISMGSMSNEQYAAFLNSLEEKKVAYEAEQEKIRLENDRLKKEAEEKEKALAAERAESERKLKEQQEKAAAEKAKLEAELQSKKDAELAEQKAKEAAELAAKQEADKLAKAPDKEQLNAWLNSIKFHPMPITSSNEAQTVATDITAKFAAFKGWAKVQVEKL